MALVAGVVLTEGAGPSSTEAQGALTEGGVPAEAAGLLSTVVSLVAMEVARSQGPRPLSRVAGNTSPFPRSSTGTTRIALGSR